MESVFDLSVDEKTLKRHEQEKITRQKNKNKFQKMLKSKIEFCEGLDFPLDFPRIGDVIRYSESIANECGWEWITVEAVVRARNIRVFRRINQKREKVMLSIVFKGPSGNIEFSYLRKEKKWRKLEVVRNSLQNNTFKIKHRGK